MAQAESTRVKPPRFLVDENLSVLLPNAAQAHNFEAIHVNHRGLHQARDWEILRIAIEEEWVLVTNNAIEFRGRYQKLDIHPGGCFPPASGPPRAAIGIIHGCTGCDR
jgi:hypothetical protein